MVTWDGFKKWIVGRGKWSHVIVALEYLKLTEMLDSRRGKE